MLEKAEKSRSVLPEPLTLNLHQDKMKVYASSLWPAKGLSTSGLVSGIASQEMVLAFGKYSRVKKEIETRWKLLMGNALREDPSQNKILSLYFKWGTTQTSCFEAEAFQA